MTEGTVVDRDGISATMEGGGAGAPVSVRLSNGRRVAIPTEQLRELGGGRFATELSFREMAPDAAPEVRLPVIEEQMELGHRAVTTGVRVEKRVLKREETVDLPSRNEEVTVQHVPIGRLVDGPQPVRQEGDTTIVPVLDEVAVVEKRWMLREEVRITRRATEEVRSERVVLRSEELSVEPARHE